MQAGHLIQGGNKAGAKKCCKETKITAPPNERHNIRFSSFAGNWQSLQRTQSCSITKAGASRSKIGSIPRVRGRNAHSTSLFLHACRTLARLYMVTFSSL